MKQLLTTLLLLFSLTLSAQTVDVVGPKKKPKTAAPAKPKQQAEQKQTAHKQQTAAKAHAAPTFICNQCGQKLNSQEQLSTHIANVHTFKCDKCRENFDAQALLDAHITKNHAQQELRTESFKVNGVSFKMCYVKCGTFLMGATSEQGSDAGDNEKPAHRVTVSDYYIGQTEVTQALWQAVMGNNPSNWKGDNLPVERVSWDDCQSFIEKLNAKTGRSFRLPTEAEWEFASRGGNNSRGYKYSGSNYIDDVAWYTNNSNSKTHTVATKQANELGIYDMSGNVWEWCSDWFDSSYYKNSDSNNPRGAYTGSYRVNRGGGWDSRAGYCRVSNRDDDTPVNRYNILGLRLVLRP